jgi:hypothetical protein
MAASELVRHWKPTRHGYSYEDVRWQKSVRRIARRSTRGAARRVGCFGAGQGMRRTLADARGGGSEVRTVCVTAQRLHPEDAARHGDRDYTRLVATRRKAPRSRVSSSEKRCSRCGLWPTQVNARNTASNAVPVPAAAGAGIGTRCLRGRLGCQRSATCSAKAAPADEARAVSQTRRRKAPVPQGSLRGSAVDAKAAPRSAASDMGRSKLADANSQAILPAQSEPRERNGSGGRSRRTNDA